MSTRQTTDRGGLSRRHVLAWGALASLAPVTGRAASSAELQQDAQAALQQLYATTPAAKELGAKARAVLVFPKIVKAGMMVGGQTGEGVLFRGPQAVAYYRISAASFGLQLGVQKFGYALFFMTQDALNYLSKSEGWAIGSGPSVVVVDKGMAKTINTTTLSQAVYAVAFGQQGLMAGLGLEGSKITQISPK